MRLIKWCKHIKIGSVGGSHCYMYPGFKYKIDRIIVDDWNYCPECGKANPIRSIKILKIPKNMELGI